ncbi:MAG: DNA-methyltransferase [Promethearchaeota archaeon]
MANSIYENQIFLQDSRKMSPLPDSVIDLMVTSPPYNVTKQYDANLSLGEYLQLLEDVLREVWRVLIPGGLAAVNIANVGRKPYIPLDCYVIEILQDIGFSLHQEIIWAKDASAGGSCAWGSWKSASNPSLRDVHEYIILALKPGTPNTLNSLVHGQRKEEFWKKMPKELDNKPLTINQDEFFTNLWSMGTESARRVNHPAPFRVELPFRLIQLFTQPGDLILDPFMGSGSTALAALSSGRKYVGFEIDEHYIKIANNRIATLTGAPSRASKAQAVSPPEKNRNNSPKIILKINPKTKPKAKKGTQTTAFGVSKRESHDATRFYSSRLYNGLQINLKQPVIDRSHLLADRFQSKNPNPAIEILENLENFPDYSVHLVIAQIPSYNASLYQSEQNWIAKMQSIVRNFTRILITGGRLVLICQNEAVSTSSPKIPSSETYFPTHAKITQLLIQERLILRGNVILTKSKDSNVNNLSPAYDIAIFGCKDILKRFKSPPKKGKREKKTEPSLEKDSESPHFSEKTDTVSRDQFLAYTKSIWRPAPELMESDNIYIEKQLYSPKRDYLQRFLHLFSFAEDTILMGFSAKNAPNSEYFNKVRKKVLYFTI